MKERNDRVLWKFLGFCTNYPFIESIQVKFKYMNYILLYRIYL